MFGIHFHSPAVICELKHETDENKNDFEIYIANYYKPV